jgi:hypothetical protein
MIVVIFGVFCAWGPVCNCPLLVEDFYSIVTFDTFINSSAQGNTTLVWVNISEGKMPNIKCSQNPLPRMARARHPPT